MDWYYIPVNPEPWAVGSLSLGHRNGKTYPKIGPNIQLVAAQEAIREELRSMPWVKMIEPGEYSVQLYFWRLMSEWITPTGRKASSSQADATNMQKATEDALQGILFDNDKNVRTITSRIVEQGPDIIPGIGIGIEPWIPEYVSPSVLLLRSQYLTYVPESNNSWPPKEF